VDRSALRANLVERAVAGGGCDRLLTIGGLVQYLAQYARDNQAWEDYLHWHRTDRKVLKRINDLIQEIARAPFEGVGKPEPLRHALVGYWSRRIDDEHRPVYKLDKDAIIIAQAPAGLSLLQKKW
jgi:toxin YoeB